MIILTEMASGNGVLYLMKFYTWDIPDSIETSSCQCQSSQNIIIFWNLQCVGSRWNLKNGSKWWDLCYFFCSKLIKQHHFLRKMSKIWIFEDFKMALHRFFDFFSSTVFLASIPRTPYWPKCQRQQLANIALKNV